jgi:hypothetical protein
MAKKIISEAIQKKFDKPQFQIGVAVFFSWLGQKQYGHVTNFKKTNWGISYTVTTAVGRNYPCGICISNETTPYKTGLIFYEGTKAFKQEDLERRINSERTRPGTSTLRPLIITPGDKPKPKPDIIESNGADTSSTSAKNTTGRSKGNDISNRATSKKSKLEQAFEKQRSFLDFTKPLQKD